MRRAGVTDYEAFARELLSHVRDYPISFEVIADARTFKRPVNYVLVRIIPPKDVAIDPKARPFVIVDHR